MGNEKSYYKGTLGRVADQKAREYASDIEFKMREIKAQLEEISNATKNHLGDEYIVVEELVGLLDSSESDELNMDRYRKEKLLEYQMLRVMRDTSSLSLIKAFGG
ncbi:hypothetical protein [Alkalicoccobacillus gibsonii]|uniref:hypothetical protein n=1 Tax=Alkalicoccobacillus gibsonii TaxID=79881 RepID=UPI0019317E42|nr:hypothetical protein [Alkalicoccobacillus gibsonii]MBM0064772.1 hypothetical protein [Alkalicoccobacillus gibsonii]